MQFCARWAVLVPLVFQTAGVHKNARRRCDPTTRFVSCVSALAAQTAGSDRPRPACRPYSYVSQTTPFRAANLADGAPRIMQLLASSIRSTGMDALFKRRSWICERFGLVGMPS